MPQHKPGYLLPVGDVETEDFSCAIVFYPNKDEYRRALLGALTYLSTWLAWENDADKRAKDAANTWKEALELTLECWNMSCFDNLVADVNEIKLLLQSRDCCDGDIITYGDQTTYNTNIVPNSGDPPDEYGETAVTDWPDWLEHVCHNSHLWLDQLVKQGNQLETVLDVGGLSVGLVAFAIAAIALFVVGGFISGPVVIAITAGIIAGYTSNMFSDAADDIEAARDDIVCALLNGTSLALAVENALSSGTAWDLFFSSVDYDTAQAIIYEGGDGTIFLDAATKDDCADCLALGEYQHVVDFETGTWENMSHDDPAALDDINGRDPSWGVLVNYNAGKFYFSHNELRFKLDSHIGVSGDTLTIHSVSFWYKCSAGTQVPRMINSHQGGSEANNYTHQTSWTKVTEYFSPPLVSDFDQANVVHFLGASGSTGFILFDDIVIDVDTYTAP